MCLFVCRFSHEQNDGDKESFWDGSDADWLASNEFSTISRGIWRNNWYVAVFCLNRLFLS